MGGRRGCRGVRDVGEGGGGLGRGGVGVRLEGGDGVLEECNFVSGRGFELDVIDLERRVVGIELIIIALDLVEFLLNILKALLKDFIFSSQVSYLLGLRL